jgi:hypothetical protein
MKEGKFKLVVKEEGTKARAKEIMKGSYWHCLAKFHELCSFSYLNHKRFVSTHYDIKSVKS